jgi:hypothetical protein
VELRQRERAAAGVAALHRLEIGERQSVVHGRPSGGAAGEGRRTCELSRTNVAGTCDRYLAPVPAPDLVLLLPPSEGKAAGGDGRWRPTSGTFGRRLGDVRRRVIDALAATELGPKHLGVSGELLARAAAATDAIVAGKAKALPADERYTGVVWEHLDPTTLDDDRRRRVLVPSALLGLVAATDPVPDHRLKFDVSLAGVGRLDRWWRPHLTDALRARPASTFVDLLPNEHRAAVDLDAITARSRKHTVVRTAFTGASGHDAKAVKGKLARHLLDHGLAAETVAAFAWQGWTAAYDAERRVLIASR